MLQVAIIISCIYFIIGVIYASRLIPWNRLLDTSYTTIFIVMIVLWLPLVYLEIRAKQ